MILSGAMFPFDKLNRNIARPDRVPVIAEMMPTRWSYEALMVKQFTGNEYGRRVYPLKKQMSISDFNTIYRIPRMVDALDKSIENLRQQGSPGQENSELRLLKNEIGTISASGIISPFVATDSVTPGLFTEELGSRIREWIASADREYRRVSHIADMSLDNYVSNNREALDILYNNYHNDKLEDIVRKVYERNKMLEFHDRLIQNADLIYLEPMPSGPLRIRTHFMAPVKNFLGLRIDTFTFNTMLVLFSVILLYILLYFEVLRRIIRFFEDLRFQKQGRTSLQ